MSNEIKDEQFRIGSSCFAKDFANSWYKSKIVDLDLANKRAKIHFLGWNSRYDQWFDTDNGDIKFTEETNIQTKSKPVMRKNSKKDSTTTSTTEKEPVNKTDDSSITKYPIGAKISAKWIDENYYPCEILRHVMKMSILYYEVRFYDGIKKLIRFNNTRDLAEGESILYFAPVEVAKPVEKLSEGGEDRRAEAELLLAIRNPHLKEEISTDLNQIKVESNDPVDPNKTDSNLRKSSRVKRLKTFKDEIVFYNPSTMGYNLEALTSQDSTSQLTKKRKSITSIETHVENKLEEVAVVKEELIEPIINEPDDSAKIQIENTKKIQNFFKELKPSQKATKSLKLEKSLKKKILTTNGKKTLTKYQIKMAQKKREDKKEIIQKLIETSQLTLKRQQELLEKQIRRHQHMKLKKKMLKMLRKQKQKQKFNLVQITDSNPAINTTTDLNLTQQTNNGYKHTLAINEPIRCNFSNCDKTFRKQSLLEYHMKYHHYVDINMFNNFETTSLVTSQQQSTCQLNIKPQIKRSKNRQDSIAIEETNVNNLLETDDNIFNEDEDDPYDVIHCTCGNHRTDGFMIQCEVCLCWQHKVCLNLNADQNIPKHHLCWICNEPGNKLKKLKYQSWMQIKNEKELTKPKLKNSTVLKIDDPSQQRLRLLNNCSRKYYNLNLLMYTLEYQSSLLSKLTKNKGDIRNSILNEENSVKEQIEKLAVNITHLQSCAMKKFDDFNQKLDELEKYPNEENTLPRFFNLQELYNQLQSLVYQ